MRKIILIILVLMMSACTVEQETETYSISLTKNYEISDVDFASIVSVEIINDFVVIFSATDIGYTMLIYDAQSGSKIRDIFISDTEFLIIDYDLSDTRLYLSGVNLLSSENVVNVYELFSTDVEQVFISKYNDEMFYEGYFELFDDYALIHMFTGFSGKGMNYVMDFKDRNVSKVQEYEILNVVMDATLIDLYNARDIITENHIFFSALNYTDTYNYIGVYDLKSKELVEQSFTDSNQTCEIESSSNINDKLLIKSICSNVNYLIVYDVYSLEEDFRMVYPFDNLNNESRVSVLNKDFVIFTNGNYERFNAEIKVYDIHNMSYKVIPNIDNIEWFGSKVSLHNDFVIIVSSENQIYRYNITEETMENVNLTVGVNQIFDIVKGFIVFKCEDTGLLMTYNLDSESLQTLNDDYDSIDYVRVTDNSVLVVYNNQYPVVEIYDISIVRFNE